MRIEPLKHAAQVLEEVTQAIRSATNRNDPSLESMVAVAHIMEARNILLQLVRYLQLGATDAVIQFLKDAAHDRERLALPDMQASIRGEITTALVAARLITQAQSAVDLADCQNIIVTALGSMATVLNGSPGGRLN
jgi:hypothetical protein